MAKFVVSPREDIVKKVMAESMTKNLYPREDIIKEVLAQSPIACKTAIVYDETKDKCLLPLRDMETNASVITDLAKPVSYAWLHSQFVFLQRNVLFGRLDVIFYILHFNSTVKLQWSCNGEYKKFT